MNFSLTSTEQINLLLLRATQKATANDKTAIARVMTGVAERIVGQEQSKHY